MEHLEIFIYALALVMGSATLLILGPFSLRARNPMLLRLFLFLFAYTLDIFGAIVHRYIRANVPGLVTSLYPCGVAAMNLFHYFLMFAILQFLTLSSPKARARGWALAGAALSIACFLADTLLPAGALAILPFSVDLLDGVFFGCIAFTVIRGALTVRRGGENERWLLSRVFVVVSAFFPFLVNDDVQWVSMPLRFSPLQYASLSVLLLVYASKFYLSEYYVSSGDIACLRGEANPGAPFFGRYGLTEREAEICLLVLQGYSNRKIGDRLYISLSTVKSHVYSLYRKTGVENRFELMQLAKNHTEV